MKYRKKPVVIEAFLWTGGPDQVEDPEWVVDAISRKEITFSTEGMLIHTLGGIMTASPGDFIIKGVNGEIYPCKPDIFTKTYETADTPAVEPTKTQWTSVKDGLPEEKESVLVAYIGFSDKKVYTDGCARLDDGWKWTLDDEEVIVEITHWMPLPEPPRDEGWSAYRSAP